MSPQKVENERRNAYELLTVEQLVGTLAPDDHQKLAKMSPALLSFIATLVRRALEKAEDEMRDELEAEAESAFAEKESALDVKKQEFEADFETRLEAARRADAARVVCPNCGEAVPNP